MACDEIQRTLIMFKPDAVQRGLVGRIVRRFEDKGLKISALKMSALTRELVETHYAAHRGEDFYGRLVDFVTSGPVVLLVLEGKGAVEIVRSMVGPTFGPDAPAGTIRGDFGMSRRFNLIHASDSPETAEGEIELFFRPEEIVDYELHGFRWIYDVSDGALT